MKYVCLDDGAIAELLSGRQMQSVDFQEGAAFVNLLKGTSEAFKDHGNIVMTARADGLFLSTAGAWKLKRYLVIDCTESGLFTQLSASETLIVLQKAFRFCAKYWSGSGIYNGSERMISKTTKAVLFPLAFSKSSGFRVAIERDPDAKRLKARDLAGRFLLVYKSGYDGANSATEVAPLTNFKRVLDALPEIYASLPEKKTIAEARKANDTEVPLIETLLSDDSISTRDGAFLPLDHWLNRLTEKQRSFVFAPNTVAQRLIGAAGTGKTATLLLRSIVLCKEAEKHGRPFRALFITHSEATRRTALEVLEIMDPGGFHSRNGNVENISLSVKTLAAICTDVLRAAIHEAEFVDRDAQDSKILQGLYIEQSLKAAREADLKSHMPFMSATFRDFMINNSDQDLSPIFQHEISVQIKGRAGGKFDVYKDCPPLDYGLPVRADADKGFAYVVFRKYEDHLRSTGQFDTDDVVISAIGQLDTPIWKRRRIREGFDYISIDETHLFNLNELQVFHYLTREESTFPISFAIDRAQAVGDRGWRTANTEELALQASINSEVVYSAVFRSASNIVAFSASILASGVSLFSDFSNSLSTSQSSLTADEEKLSQPILYHEASDDAAMIEAAFRRASELQRLTDSRPWEILITYLNEPLGKVISDYIEENNKPVTVIDRRGDYSKIREAEKSGHMVIGHADFVGGLEFNAVIVLGVDKGRVPLEKVDVTTETRNFQKYAAHNRLYVAASRARLALELMGLSGRGASELLVSSIGSGLIEVRRA